MKKILGAHNANTYLEPRKWWMKLINFTSKCQKLPIKKQFEYGVRYFDFRIRYDKELELFLNCHGLVEYTTPANQTVFLLSILASVKETETIYIRFVYDDTFNNNIIWQLIKKSSWKRIDSDNRPQPAIVDCFKNYRGYKWIPFPQRYISKHKEHYQEIIDNTRVEKNTVFLCDRVDLFKIK